MTLSSIPDLLPPENICLDLDVARKEHLFDAIGKLMQRQHGLRSDWISLALARREEIGSTALGQGLAIPHARIKDLAQTQVAYVRVQRPIAFAAPDGKPVSDFLVLLVPQNANAEHLRLLSNAAQMFSDEDFRACLDACRDAPAIKQAFASWREVEA
jgi:nitrogen PTS system EIIA component